MSNTGGSVKRGIVAQELIDERANCAFDQTELQKWLHGGEERFNIFKGWFDTFGADPELRNCIEFYEMTPHEMQENLWRRILALYKKHKQGFFVKPYIAPPYVDFFFYFQGLLPGIGLQQTMFRTSIENLANEEQKARWLP